MAEELWYIRNEKASGIIDGKGNIIYNPKATHTFEEIEMKDLISYLEKVKNV